MSDLYMSYKVMDSNEGQVVQTISSREVAKTMEVRHDHLSEKIYGINKIFDDLKIESEKYWFESTFENRGKQYREYQVTKLGCELLCKKSAGKKGYILASKLKNVFPDIYESLIVFNLERGEVRFLNSLEDALKPFNIQGIRQYMVLSYRIDYYIPSLNIAIEYDENGHKNYTYEAHEGRQAEIEKELGCRFIRVNDSNTDDYNIGLVIKNIFGL